MKIPIIVLEELYRLLRGEPQTVTIYGVRFFMAAVEILGEVRTLSLN